MSAREIALSAYAQAVAAEEARLAAIEADREAGERAKRARHQETFEIALPILNEWFPGIRWSYEVGGDWGYDTLLFDAHEQQYPPSFKLLARRVGTKGEGKVEFEVGNYVVDHMSGGYSYFSGTKVKSPADLGRYLKSKEERNETN